MKIKFIIIILCFVQYNASAQDFSSFYSYLLNRVNVNPALAGNSSAVEGVMDYRSQYNGIAGGPRNLMFALHSPISANQGAGIKVIQDSRGAFGVTRVDGLYSHRFFLSDSNFSIRLGLSAGIISRHLNTSNIGNTSSMFDLSDPTLTSSAYNYTRFISGFGMLVNYKQLEFGFSAPQIIENSNSIGQYLVGTLSYKYKIASTRLDLQPLLIYQNLPITKNLLDVAVRATWDDKINFLVGYANNKTLKASFGLQFKGFGLAYMYEHPMGYRKELSNGTHEIMVNISIEKKMAKSSPTKMIKDLNALINYLKILKHEEAKYTQDFVKLELESVQKELYRITDQNTDKNIEKAFDKFDKIGLLIADIKTKYGL
ncbi:PorP/SprF family type IX secretion system membrane protein [uncultured Cytophaga sp.]|uniref:PorP/SprF family type IX secretion system membrane protein n=1 Tax=uncultured Cytophaga sp. TaxID=160238 RepID=UPI00262AABB3|nr:PorP/SprF family type IX secretion system membrane protein [uncultured Cytophaga sp.]